MRHKALHLTFLFLPLSFGHYANAQEVSPCAKEIATFCSEIAPGNGGVAACLKEHEKELTPACRELLQSENKERKQRRRVRMVS